MWVSCSLWNPRQGSITNTFYLAGIGISGQEGLQAAHSADYSIAQFRFLTRLLLVHGSWSLSRLCKLILYSFYKNIALYVIELWFATVSAWSGQTIFERWTIGLYNVIFTAAPPLAIGLFDRQCSADTMLKNPSLYKSFDDQFSTRLFWVWIWSAILHSLSLFWLTHFLVSNDTLWQSGLSDGGYLVFGERQHDMALLLTLFVLLNTGNMLYTFVVITVCLKAALEITSWTWITHVRTTRHESSELDVKLCLGGHLGLDFHLVLLSTGVFALLADAAVGRGHGRHGHDDLLEWRLLDGHIRDTTVDFDGGRYVQDR